LSPFFGGKKTARIQLDGSERYLVTFELFDQLGFVSHKALQVLMCQKCKICVIPADLIGHAESCQNISRKSVSVQDLNDLVHKQSIHLDTSSVIHPSPRGPPVEGLAEPVEGYACSVDRANCDYCCTSLRRMETHVRTHLGRPLNMVDCYHSKVKLQKLFPHFGIKLFEVEPTLSNISITDPFSRILRDLLPVMPGESLFSPNLPRLGPDVLTLGWRPVQIPPYRWRIKRRRGLLSYDT
jgi:hypothetical protein